jgi:hypothetical protein
MKKILIYIPAVTTLISLLVAQTAPNTSVRQFPPQSTAIKGVLVPVPREIFDTLDKFAHSNWRAVQRPELAQQRPHGDQSLGLCGRTEATATTTAVLPVRQQRRSRPSRSSQLPKTVEHLY